MEDKAFDLEEYLTSGVENIVKDALKASLSNPKESLFMAKFALACRKASKLRHKSEKTGEHVPPFLIASITSSCNLHCAGCYSNAFHSGKDTPQAKLLSAETWRNVFQEAADMGISFILLAGGEPLLRKDVIREATAVPAILFPVFTNGILLNDDYLSVFDQNRNLVPVLSIEGNENTTDQRRGNGVYRALNRTMKSLQDRGILFGISITVTTRNLKEVLSQDFINDLCQKGCKLVVYVEYVPIDENTESLAIGDAERTDMKEHLVLLRNNFGEMIFVSFPGDEKTSGGCLASGRGFFHINAYGGVEPCPFSPYSDVNVKDVGVAGALHSRLFKALWKSGLLTEDHEGGCVLFKRDSQVKELMVKSK